MASSPSSQGSLLVPDPHRAPPGKRPATTNDDADDENRRKDPKITRACDTCKRKKIRCDGTLPCKNCARRKLHCFYNAKYNRGRPPTPPPSTTIIEHHARWQSDHSKQSSNSQHLRGVTHHAPESSIQSRASPEAEYEAQYSDPTSGLNFLQRAWKKLLTQNDESALYQLNSAGKDQLLTSVGDPPFHVDDAVLDDVIPAASTARDLQEFYFETCVVTYRMFHRQVVEGWMEILLNNRQERRPITHALGNSRTAILLTIMAIAALRREKINGERSQGDEMSGLRTSDQYFTAGMRLTDMETGFPRLESVQARLIQVLYLLQTARMNKAWYTFGNAFHVTLSLGMHRRRDQRRDFPLPGHPHNYIIAECYKRTFWVAYIIDTYLSIVFGRPRLYRDEDIDQDFPDMVNDEDMKPQGPSISDDPGDCYIDALILHAKIAQIIGKVSREVYSISDLPNQDRLAAAQRLCHDLHEWWASLPPHLGTVRPSTLIPSFRRQAIAMRLAYFHALIHANRPFLLSEGAYENIAECINAAKDSLELLNRMAEDSTLFYSFWWTHYVMFCVLAVVYVWEIQQTTRSSYGNDDQSLSKIFELAEKCYGHLKRASTSLSQNQRYSFILDELRSEAQRCRNARESLQSQLLGNIHGVEGEGHVADIGFTLPQDLESCGPHTASLLQEGTMPSVLENLQFSDWLMLDSSAFLPLSDTNYVSPTNFPVIE
ncbi:hypothetical protein ASPBRDRAFT_191064 [Aspergillus brasiliensis CBS 101740]|uniref:Zn(2)-C6 fungal-type domain-containing protein n=1 Tax=Aspergillus brasiliensis (strain CBS 101740 / IMI 381727 / IBT 21946) TaxID=767769 RepID=A0A1L9V1I1_ASPBC|nr:hypothetical protein ASPBRDRAFT_191064 [Aspergillus brasiliensis CBS 101740]